LSIENTFVEAYQNAEYVIFAEPELVLLVGNYSEALKAIMTKTPFKQAAFITAYNPYSEIFDESENLKRHATLSTELTQLGFSFLLGEGRDKERQWPSEISVLVLNILNDTAKTLGNKYGQNAILWIEEDAIPQLLLLNGKSG
jgi:hypothetical protein